MSCCHDTCCFCSTKIPANAEMHKYYIGPCKREPSTGLSLYGRGGMFLWVEKDPNVYIHSYCKKCFDSLFKFEDV